MRMSEACELLAMAHLMGSDGENYEEFYGKWMDQQKAHLGELEYALESDMREEEVRQLVAKVLRHYEEYYEVKDRAVRGNVLQLIQPSWRPPLETAFLWIGGWRPTMVFQLAYAQSGFQLEQELAELLRGVDTPTMASLSSRQLSQINKLQMKTQADEEELTQRMAVMQQGLADQPLLGLALAGLNGADETATQGGMREVFDEKIKALEELLVDADRLRLTTLKEMLKILNAVQGAQYLMAAAQLQIALRNFGEQAGRSPGDGDGDGGR